MRGAYYRAYRRAPRPEKSRTSRPRRHDPCPTTSSRLRPHVQPNGAGSDKSTSESSAHSDAAACDLVQLHYIDSFSGFGIGEWKFGMTGSIGFGADFGSNFTTIQGVSLKYTLHYVPSGVAIMGYRDDSGKILDFRNTYIFQGIQISLNLGKMFVK